MKNMNYTPQPISTDDVKLSDDIIMLSEQIAEKRTRSMGGFAPCGRMDVRCGAKRPP